MINNVYGYYLAQYGPRTNPKHSSHKPSELKVLYGKLLKVNSQTPFYKLDTSEAAQKYAIDLKENAYELSNTMNELSSSTDSMMINFKKIAESNNDQIVSVNYIGDNSPVQNVPFEVNVKQLATEQINTGNYLQQKSKLLSPGDYSFNLDLSSLTYQFEFNIKNDDTSRSIQDKISRLINRSNLGLNSFISTDSLDNSAIIIKSESTGVSNIKSTIFSITPSDSHQEIDTIPNNDTTMTNQIVNVLGLNRVTQYPTNAIFEIDGTEYSSNTNKYIVNDEFELNFHQITENSPVIIDFINDTDAIVHNISNLIDGYNKFMKVTTDEQNSRFSGNDRLMHEFSKITDNYRDLLKKSGIELNEDGMIELNKETIIDSTNEGTISDIFNNLGKFKNALQSKVEYISLNPMEYVNNKIVSYKNPTKLTTFPYFISIYSGMIFNSQI